MHYSIIIYSLISFLILFLCAKISYRLRLVDLPDKRKIHSIATAYTGGIGLSISFLFSIILFQIASNNLNLILSIAFLICIIGFIDDKFPL